MHPFFSIVGFLFDNAAKCNKIHPFSEQQKYRTVPGAVTYQEVYLLQDARTTLGMRGRTGAEVLMALSALAAIAGPTGAQDLPSVRIRFDVRALSAAISLADQRARHDRGMT